MCRGRLINLEDGKEHWVSFKYEQLPNLCYWCGCLTHDDSDCEFWINSEGTLKLEEQQFGPWLRASPFLASRKKVVSVPGFFAKKPSNTPAQPSINPNSQQQPEANQTSTTQTTLHPRSFNANSDSQGHKSSSEPNPAKSRVCAKAASPLNQSNHVAFEEVLQDIDRDLLRFDGMALPSENSNISITASTSSDNLQPEQQVGQYPKFL